MKPASYPRLLGIFSLVVSHHAFLFVGRIKIGPGLPYSPSGASPFALLREATWHLLRAKSRCIPRDRHTTSWQVRPHSQSNAKSTSRARPHRHSQNGSRIQTRYHRHSRIAVSHQSECLCSSIQNGSAAPMEPASHGLPVARKNRSWYFPRVILVCNVWLNLSDFIAIHLSV